MASNVRVGNGYFNMAESEIKELVGKTEAEIYALLDKRLDKVLEKEAKCGTRRLRTVKSDCVAISSRPGGNGTGH
jgi:hypothetical protein